jgi:Glyoxalase-like domain
MRGRSEAGWWGVVLEAPDARALAWFYAELLGWRVAKDEPSWVTVAPPSGVAYLEFQTSPQYIRPVWPAADGRQQMMMHLAQSSCRSSMFHHPEVIAIRRRSADRRSTATCHPPDVERSRR